MAAREDSYSLPDPELRAYDHGLGTLSVDGELRGHLACVVSRMTFPSKGPWPWFRVIWLDGRREPRFEDYGPGWWTVRELDAGKLEYSGPSVDKERRILGFPFRYSVSGDPCVFDLAWLDREEAAAKWDELGLTDGDF
jgi:hypothetical protein